MNSLLKLENVTLKYEQTVLHNLNYEIHEGDFIVILGSNGSGKSSLLKLIARQIFPTFGTIYLNNKSIADQPRKKMIGNIKTLTQNCSESLFNSLTVFENYLLIIGQGIFFSHRKARTFLKNYLQQYNPNLTNKLDQLVEQLSGGEKQALALALIMLNPPKILLLDEHTSALDPNTSTHIMRLTYELVKKHGITCLLTTHDLQVATQYGNRLLALRNGKIHQMINGEEKINVDQISLLAACY